MHVFELQELEAATAGFSPSELIGKGSHGAVYRGRLNGGSLTVAVKKQSLALRDNSKLENEAKILSSFPPTSTSFVNFLGVGLDSSGNKIIVTQYMSNGTLHEALHGSDETLSWPRRFETALQIAKGVRFLHESSPPIVHRDIKSANILFDKMWTAKLCDFGLAMRMHDQTKSESRLPAGTMGYIDPCYTTPEKVSTSIDVFSYGVVLLEIVSGRKAIDVSKSPASIVDWALPLIEKGRAMEVCDKRVRMSLEMAQVIKGLLRVASRCVSPEESDRPGMEEVVASLEGLRVGSIRFSTRTRDLREVILEKMGLGKYVSGKGTNINRVSKGTLLVREILADVNM